MLESFKTCLRILFFLSKKKELLNLNHRHLALGMFFVWLAGMGRYWDHPKAEWFQYLGLGSLLYVFFLSLILEWLIFPLRPSNWTYRRTLTYVCLTAPPAFLYAIPVELWYDTATANNINMSLLGIVAAWRVLLFARFIRLAGNLNWGYTIVGLSIPLMLIVLVLFMLNLEKAAFDVMGGIRNSTPYDGAYEILSLLFFYSIFAFIPLLVVYICLIIIRGRSLHSRSAFD